jgi:hypothetical protein
MIMRYILYNCTDHYVKKNNTNEENTYKDIRNLSLATMFIFLLSIFPIINNYFIKSAVNYMSLIALDSHMLIVLVILLILFKDLLKCEMLDDNLLNNKKKYVAIALSCICGILLLIFFMEIFYYNWRKNLLDPSLYVLLYSIYYIMSCAFKEDVLLSVICLIINLIISYLACHKQIKKILHI